MGLSTFRRALRFFLLVIFLVINQGNSVTIIESSPFLQLAGGTGDWAEKFSMLVEKGRDLHFLTF